MQYVLVSPRPFISRSLLGRDERVCSVDSEPELLEDLADLILAGDRDQRMRQL